MGGLKRFAVRGWHLALLVLVSCGQDVATAPREPAGTLKPAESDFTIVQVHLRPAEGSDSQAWGKLQVWTGFVPPNPCVAGLEGSAVAVCGLIHNPGGEIFTSGLVSVVTGPDAEPIVLRFDAPPNPCRTSLLRGATPVLSTPGPPDVEASFLSSAGEIVSANPGPPDEPFAGTPGPPDEPVCEVIAFGRG
jgi:hypothetical protein